jgi:hypothetical protein
MCWDKFVKHQVGLDKTLVLLVLCAPGGDARFVCQVMRDSGLVRHRGVDISVGVLTYGRPPGTEVAVANASGASAGEMAGEFINRAQART